MSAAQQSPYSWRVIDFVTAAILAVVTGLIFFANNNIGYPIYKILDAATPGFGGLMCGPWFIGGVLGGLIIRKPGAAVFVELLGAVVSAALGAQWGIEVLYSGVAQGLFAELVFASMRYKRFGLIVALVSGACASLGDTLLQLLIYGNLAKGLTYNVIYALCNAVSGAVLAGLVAYLLVKALARSGALDRFAVGREHRTQV